MSARILGCFDVHVELQRGRALGVRTSNVNCRVEGVERAWFVSRGRIVRATLVATVRGVRWPSSLARFVLSATATTTGLAVSSQALGAEHRVAYFEDTGASTPFKRTIDTKKSSVQEASRKSAGANSPSCTKTRSPRTTSTASMSFQFQAPSRLCANQSVSRVGVDGVKATIYALRDTTCVGAHRRQRAKQGSKQQTTAGQSHGGLGLFGPSRAKRSRASAQDRPSVLWGTSISSTSSSWMAELVALIAASSTDECSAHGWLVFLQAAVKLAVRRQISVQSTPQPLARHCWAPVLAAIMAC